MLVLKRLFKFSVYSGIAGLLALLGLYLYIRPDLPSVETLKDVRLQTPMKVYSAEGELISQFGEKRRIPLNIEDMPDLLVNAYLATEDSRFYEHPGVDFIGVIRAAVTVAVTGQKKQGASTITMQLARNFYLTREKTWIRKIKELFIALHIEQLLSKNEILELYLNKIPLGNRSYGVGAAAQVYYGKTVDQLTLPEMAILAGLPKAPSTLNPIRSPERAKKRRAVVLGRMRTVGLITQEQFKDALNAPITAKYHGAQITAHAPYVAEIARQEMVNRYGAEEAYTGGYQVWLTVSAKQQLAAQQAVVNNLHAYDERHGYYGPVAKLWDEPIIEPEEGTSLTANDSNDTTSTDAEIPPPVETDKSNAWTYDQIKEHLSDIRSYGELEPGIVTEIINNQAYVQLKKDQLAVISWDNIKWARPHITDSRQDKEPKTIWDVITPGNQIWVRKLSDGEYRLAQIPQVSGALVALDPMDGAIKAVVGGYNFYLSEYNRVTQAKRQVGSNIKPFVYSAALDNGFTLASIINDAPINQWDRRQGTAWRPKNSPDKYDGPIRVRKALAQSKNVVSVRLLRGVGLKKTIDHLTQFGFAPDDLPRNESLALGSAALTPIEVVTGIATFANGGYLVEPYIINKIDDIDNKTVWQAEPAVACRTCTVSNRNNTSIKNLAPRVISPQNAFLIAQAMNSAIQGGGSWKHKTRWAGTGWRAVSLKRNDISGKTGTTNDAKDTWFSGFTPDLVATTWVGFDNPGRDLGRTSYNRNLDKTQVYGAEAGAKTAQPAWIEFMKHALEGQPEQSWFIPDELVSVRIDKKTGLLSRKSDHTTRFEYFVKGTEPKQYVADDSTPVIFDNDDEGKVEEEDEIF